MSRRPAKLGVVSLLLLMALVWASAAGAWIGTGGSLLAREGPRGDGDTDPDDFPIMAHNQCSLTDSDQEHRHTALPLSLHLTILVSGMILR